MSGSGQKREKVVGGSNETIQIQSVNYIMSRNKYLLTRV